MSYSVSYDTLYKKDVQGFRVDKGSTREIRYKIPYASLIVIRINATYPVDLTMAGPHMEHLELMGTREFKFNSNPGNELVIRFQGKSGFFAKPSDVTLEVEMYTSRDVIKISEEIKSLLGTLKELGRDYYMLVKEHIQNVLTKMSSVWGLLDEETKSQARELLSISKKFEEGKE